MFTFCLNCQLLTNERDYNCNTVLFETQLSPNTLTTLRNKRLVDSFTLKLDDVDIERKNT